MATFLPQEILIYNNIESAAITVTIIKTTGALYLGFAVLNWMARGNIMGAFTADLLPSVTFCTSW